MSGTIRGGSNQGFGFWIVTKQDQRSGKFNPRGGERDLH